MDRILPLSLLLALLTIAAVLGAQSLPPQTTLTLDEAVAYAQENSLTVRNAVLDVADAEQQIKERLSTGLPRLDASGSFTHYLKVPVQALPAEFLPPTQPGQDPPPNEIAFLLKNNLTLGASFSQMIFDGSFFVALEAAREARSYAQLQLNERKRFVRNQVIDAYLPVLLVTENMSQLDSNIQNVERLFRETSAQYEAGFIEQLDVDRVQLSLENLRTERENLRRRKEVALTNLKFQLNYPLKAELNVDDDLRGLAEDLGPELLAAEPDISARPELQLIDEAIRLEALNVRLQKAAYLPTLDAQAAYQQQYQGNDFKSGFWAPTALVGLQLNVPIFDGFGRRARVERARISAERTANQRTDLVRGIELEVANARTQYDNATQRLGSRQKNLELARRIYETTRIKYREGVGSSLEVTQAEQALYTAQADFRQALYDRIVARESVYKALGVE